MNKTPRFTMSVAAVFALLVLSACGNKGPLVLPQKPVPLEEQEVVPEPQSGQDPVDQGSIDAAGDAGATHG